MDHRSITAIESDIKAIESFASSYRAYWGVRTDGSDREPVKDRVALRHRLHRQLPRIEKVMALARTNSFGFGPPPIARGAPPRLGIVAVAFADEDPVYGVGGGPPCFEEVLNRLEMTLGVLESELEDAKSAAQAPGDAVTARPARASERVPEPESELEEKHTTAEQPVAVEIVQAAPADAGPARVFAHGVRRAWSEARAARGSGGSFRGKVEIAAAIATIVGTVAALGVLFGWWGG